MVNNQQQPTFQPLGSFLTPVEGNYIAPWFMSTNMSQFYISRAYRHRVTVKRSSSKEIQISKKSWELWSWKDPRSIGSDRETLSSAARQRISAWRCAPCLKIVVTCVRNSNAAALGIQIWYLPHIFKRCKSYFGGKFSGDTLSGDTSCCVQRGKRHFAGQIILFMCINLFLCHTQ